jgi:hypothetical protein
MSTDPRISSLLASLALDIARTPEKIFPLDERLIKRAEKLTIGVATSIDEDIGETQLSLARLSFPL